MRLLYLTQTPQIFTEARIASLACTIRDEDRSLKHELPRTFRSLAEGGSHYEGKAMDNKLS